MSYDFMPGMDVGALDGYGLESDNDLNQFFDFAQADGHITSGMNNLYPFERGFTPNGLNINGGMMPGIDNRLFQTTSRHGLLQYNANSGGFPFFSRG
jgi:hypothetical protein